MQLLDDLSLGQDQQQDQAIQAINDQYLSKSYRWALGLVSICISLCTLFLLFLQLRSGDWLLLLPPALGLGFFLLALIAFLKIRSYHLQKESKLSTQWNIWTWRLVFSLSFCIVIIGGTLMSIASYIEYSRRIERSQRLQEMQNITIDPNATRNAPPE